MIQSSADLGMFMKKTLLFHQAPDTCLTVADTALKFLQDSSFVQRSEGRVRVFSDTFLTTLKLDLSEKFKLFLKC